MTDLDQARTAPSPSERIGDSGSDSGGADRRSDVSRRRLLRGVTVGGLALPLLAACGGGSDDASSSGSSDGGSADQDSGDSGSGGSGGTTTVAASDVPVGGGLVVKTDKVVVTQPTKGEYKAFSAVCTHQGCTVNEVKDEMIVCPCHNSLFSVTDGSPQGGPANSALAAKKVSVSRDEITIS